MGARNPANQMTVEELIQNGLTVSKKFPISDEAWNERGLLFGMVKQRYGSNTAIREAGLFTSVQYFVPTTGERGTYALAEGPLERLDFNSDSLTVDGVRIKFSNIYEIAIDGLDPYGTDDEDDWEVRLARMTSEEKRQYERQMEELQKQMRLDWERQQEQLRRQMERDRMRQREQERQRMLELRRWNRRDALMENSPGEDCEDDDGWIPDFDPDEYAAQRRTKCEEAHQRGSGKKKETKTILWLPPGRRSKGRSGGRKTGNSPVA